MPRIALTFLALAALTSVAMAGGVLVDRSSMTLPAEAPFARHGEADDYRRATTDDRFALERLTYRSDDLVVSAYLYGPRATATPRPVVVFLRGGYLAMDPIGTVVPLFHHLASAGYTVVAPQLRQSDGAAGTDEVGGPDLADVMNVARLIRELPGLDPERIYLLGESRGGMMAYQAVRDRFPARAAAVYGAFTDLEALFRERPEQYEGLARRIWPDFDERRDDVFARRSALRWAEKLDVPLLIMHGGEDRSVDPSHARRLAGRLSELGKRFELVVFEGDGHTLQENRAERNRRIVGWFERH